MAMVALLVASAPWIMAAPHGNFHPVAMSCESCHLAGKAVTPEQAHLLLASQEKLCGTCHQTTKQVSHPSGFTPRSKLHDDYPLDWKGDLTCSTCHEVHGKTPGLMRGNRRGRELCLSCHESQFFVRMRDQGASMMETGHLDARSSGSGETLDVYSQKCMECHGEKGDDKAPMVVRNMVIRHGKHEDVYFNGYATMGELLIGLTKYFAFYNGARPHQGLDNQTPDAVHTSAAGGGAMIVDKYGAMQRLPIALRSTGTEFEEVRIGECQASCRLRG